MAYNIYLDDTLDIRRGSGSLCTARLGLLWSELYIGLTVIFDLSKDRVDELSDTKMFLIHNIHGPKKQKNTTHQIIKHSNVNIVTTTTRGTMQIRIE